MPKSYDKVGAIMAFEEGELAKCQRCPIADHCWGVGDGDNKDIQAQPIDKCPLVRIIQGNMIVRVSGYVILP